MGIAGIKGSSRSSPGQEFADCPPKAVEVDLEVVARNTTGIENAARMCIAKRAAAAVAARPTGTMLKIVMVGRIDVVGIVMLCISGELRRGDR
jgi:hypothetical protein